MCVCCECGSYDDGLCEVDWECDKTEAQLKNKDA